MTSKKKILLTGAADTLVPHSVELIQLGFETVLVDDFSKSDKTLLTGIEKITGKEPHFF